MNLGRCVELLDSPTKRTLSTKFPVKHDNFRRVDLDYCCLCSESQLTAVHVLVTWLEWGQMVTCSNDLTTHMYMKHGISEMMCFQRSSGARDTADCHFHRSNRCGAALVAHRVKYTQD